MPEESLIDPACHVSVCSLNAWRLLSPYYMKLFSATGSLCHVYTVSAHLCDSNIWLIASLSPYLNTSAITCSDTSSSASPCAEDTCYLRTRCHLTRDSASYVRCLASSPTPTLNSANRREVRVNWSNGPELWPRKEGCTKKTRNV